MWTHQLALGLMEKGKPALVINSGVSCDRTTHALARIEEDVLAFRPDYVTIMFGLNDAWITPNEEIVISTKFFGENLRKIIRKVRREGAEPILMTPNPMTERYSYYNERRTLQENGVNYALEKHVRVIRGIAREMKLDLIDFYALFLKERDWKERLVPDGLHPGIEGNRLMARTLIAYFEKKLSK